MTVKKQKPFFPATNCHLFCVLFFKKITILFTTALAGEHTWYTDIFPVLMWFTVIGKDTQHTILSVNNWYYKLFR